MGLCSDATQLSGVVSYGSVIERWVLSGRACTVLIWRLYGSCCRPVTTWWQWDRTVVPSRWLETGCPVHCAHWLENNICRITLNRGFKETAWLYPVIQWCATNIYLKLYSGYIDTLYQGLYQLTAVATDILGHFNTWIVTRTTQVTRWPQCKCMSTFGFFLTFHFHFSLIIEYHQYPSVTKEGALFTRPSCGLFNWLSPT